MAVSDAPGNVALATGPTCPECGVVIGKRGYWNPDDRLAWHRTHAHARPSPEPRLFVGSTRTIAFRPWPGETTL